MNLITKLYPKPFTLIWFLPYIFTFYFVRKWSIRNQRWNIFGTFGTSTFSGLERCSPRFYYCSAFEIPFLIDLFFHESLFLLFKNFSQVPKWNENNVNYWTRSKAYFRILPFKIFLGYYQKWHLNFPVMTRN